jgi:DNA-binding transcriptional ArsR family regulator
VCSTDLRLTFFRGLSDGSRLLILEQLAEGERRVSDIVEATGLSQPNVSAHLACLWDCGLVARERRGREMRYRLIPGMGNCSERPIEYSPKPERQSEPARAMPRFERPPKRVVRD